jgi:hypothetical protein
MSSQTQSPPRLIKADALPGVETKVRYTIPGQKQSMLYSFGKDPGRAIMWCASQPYACLLEWEDRRNAMGRRKVVELDFVRVAAEAEA